MSRFLLTFLLVISCSHAYADRVTQLIEDCDRELFFLGCNLDEAVSRGQAIVTWGIQNNSPEVESRGLIRLVFAELYYGRWRNHWPNKQKRAIEIAEGLQGDSIARAELLMFNGFLKATFFQEPEEGISDLRHAIAIGEANGNLVFLAKAHLLRGNVSTLHAEKFASMESYMRAINLANILKMKKLEHLALRKLLTIQHDLNFEPTDLLIKYQQLCDQIDHPVDIHPEVKITVEEMLQAVEETKYSIAKNSELRKPGDLAEKNYTAVRSRLSTASLYLIRYFGEELGDWERAEPYIDLLQFASERLSDHANLRYSKHYRANSLARRGEIEAAKKISQGVIDDLLQAGDVETLVNLSKSLSRAFAVGGAVDESHRLLDLVEEQNAILEAKLPTLSQSNAKMYCDLLLTKQESRRAEENHRAAEFRSRTINTLMLIGIPILAICLWFWQRAVHSRKLQEELRLQLNMKTKSLKLATEQAEKANQAKSDYLARINHELRNPLGAIVNSCELLKLQSNGSTDQHAHSTISAATSALVDVIDDVLDFTRIESGQLEFQSSSFSTKELPLTVSSITKPQLSDGVEFISNVDQKLPDRIRTDLPKLRQTILNLCSNAAKHTNQGRILVSYRFERQQEDDSVGNLVIRVEDTGCGISPELQPKIFERFLKIGDSPGSGLGLYVSKAFAKCLGGDIHCHSEVDVGTTMILSVPVQVEEAIPETSPTLTPQSTCGKRVLVVDDMDENLRSMAMLLKACGFESLTAKTWEETEHTIELGVDYVLLDLRMPEVDGFEVARRIRKKVATGRMPQIIALSGDVTQEVRDKVAEARFDGFLPKPCTVEELLESLCTEAAVTTAN